MVEFTTMKSYLVVAVTYVLLLLLVCGTIVPTFLTAETINKQAYDVVLPATYPLAILLITIS